MALQRGQWSRRRSRSPRNLLSGVGPQSSHEDHPLRCPEEAIDGRSSTGCYVRSHRYTTHRFARQADEHSGHFSYSQPRELEEFPLNASRRGLLPQTARVQGMVILDYQLCQWVSH